MLEKGDVAKAIEVLEELFPDILLDHFDCIWELDDGEVSWNTDNCEEDLYNGDGNTYTGEITREGVKTDGVYTIMNVDYAIGQDVTVVFNNDKRVEQ